MRNREFSEETTVMTRDNVYKEQRMLFHFWTLNKNLEAFVVLRLELGAPVIRDLLIRTFNIRKLESFLVTDAEHYQLSNAQTKRATMSRAATR